MDTLRWAREHTLLASALRTAAGLSNVINAGEYGSAIFFFNVTALSGAGATLTATLQMSPDNEIWYDSTTVITPITATGKQMLVVPALGRYIRFNYGIAGTLPEITFSITGAFKS